MPSTKRSSESLRKRLAEIEQRLSTRRGPRVTEAEARRRKEVALAELRELQLQQRRGELLERIEVEKAAIEKYRVFRDRLLLIPDRCADALEQKTGGEVRARIDREIREALSE